MQQAPSVWMTLSSQNESNWQAYVGPIPFLWKYSGLLDFDQCTLLNLTSGRIMGLWHKSLKKGRYLGGCEEAVGRSYMSCGLDHSDSLPLGASWESLLGGVQSSEFGGWNTWREVRDEWGTEVRGLGQPCRCRACWGRWQHFWEAGEESELGRRGQLT